MYIYCQGNPIAFTDPAGEGIKKITLSGPLQIEVGKTGTYTLTVEGVKSEKLSYKRCIEDNYASVGEAEDKVKGTIIVTGKNPGVSELRIYIKNGTNQEITKNIRIVEAAKSRFPFYGTTKADLNLRANSTTEAVSLKEIPSGTKIKITAEKTGTNIVGNNKWWQTSYDGKTGWVSSYFVNCIHSWSAWKTTKAATATVAGSKERTCANCLVKEIVSIPKTGGSSGGGGSGGGSGGSTSNPFIWPSDTKTISAGGYYSIWGYRKYDNLNGNHRGIDIPAPNGSNVYASAAGTIVSRETMLGGGRTYRIEHNLNSNIGKKYHTIYLHLSDYVVPLRDPVTNKNKTVARGDVIGKTGGSSANSNGGDPIDNVYPAHLHFEISRSKNRAHVINPLADYVYGDKRHGETNPNPIFNISKSGTWKYSSVNANFNPLYYHTRYTAFADGTTWKK
jgi:murein DD-endopeptidase MepM/ murein hydrolase activator NlpD